MVTRQSNNQKIDAWELFIRSMRFSSILAISFRFLLTLQTSVALTPMAFSMPSLPGFSFTYRELHLPLKS